MNIQNLSSEESVEVIYKDGICTKLCLKLWFESDWYFCNIIESGWFWKQSSKESLHKSSETVVCIFSSKEVFLKILQKENTCVGVSF